MRKMWSFKTRHFTVEWLIETERADYAYMEPETAAECRAKIRTGEWVCFTSIIRVVHRATKKVLSETSLGNSIYADPREFRDHFGMNGKGYGSYFSDMVREAVRAARVAFPKFQQSVQADIKLLQRALTCEIKPLALAA